MGNAPRGASASLNDIASRYRDQRVQERILERLENYTPEELDEDFGVTGLAAELLKYHNERRLIHEMLTAAGIPEVSSGEGERVCLIGRLGVALGRL